MVRYGDYFSRKVLHNCGISADKAMFEKVEMNYEGMQRLDKIRASMTEIYQTLFSGYEKNNAVSKNSSFEDYKVEGKIINAFYDSGVLNNAEREYFQTQTLQSKTEREQICVEEANAFTGTTKAQKVEEITKNPLKKDVLK